MKRFFASGSSRAERPAELLGESPASSSGQPADSFVSAEQPDFRIAYIRDVQRWLAAEHVATSSNVDAQRWQFCRNVEPGRRMCDLAKELAGGTNEG